MTGTSPYFLGRTPDATRRTEAEPITVRPSVSGQDEGSAAELQDVDIRRAEIADLYAAGLADLTMLVRINAGLDARAKDARAKLNDQRRNTVLDHFDGEPGRLRQQWPSLSDDERRSLLRAVIENVTVRASTRRARWDPERFSIVFLNR